jgi:hypothetical protein
MDYTYKRVIVVQLATLTTHDNDRLTIAGVREQSVCNGGCPYDMNQPDKFRVQVA